MIDSLKKFFGPLSPLQLLSKYLVEAERELINTEYEKDHIDHKVIQLNVRIARLKADIAARTTDKEKK